MLMGFKYQVQMTVQPEEIHFITMKHMNVMKDLVQGQEAVEFIIDAQIKFEETSLGFDAYDYRIVRQQLYKFFADKHSPVSCFNRDEVQLANGVILLDMCGLGPQNSIKPGLVKFYNEQAGAAAVRSKQIDIAH